MSYDPLNRLVSADKFDPMASATAGTLDTLSGPGGGDLLEYDGATGAIQRWYVHGAGLVNQVNVAAGTRETLIPDIQGSLIGMLDSGGTLARQGFQPYGVSGNATGPFAYTGQRLDAQTGLYNYMARMYSPALGRFLQPDPAGTGGSGNNLYAYVGNDPLDFDDPTGMCFLGCFWKSPVVKDVAIAAVTVIALQPETIALVGNTLLGSSLTAADVTAAAAGGVATVGGTTTVVSAAVATEATEAGLVAAGIGGAIGGAIQGGTLRSAAQGALLDVAVTGSLDIARGIATNGGGLPNFSTSQSPYLLAENQAGQATASDAPIPIFGTGWTRALSFGSSGAGGIFGANIAGGIFAESGAEVGAELGLPFGGPIGAIGGGILGFGVGALFGYFPGYGAGKLLDYYKVPIVPGSPSTTPPLP